MLGHVKRIFSTANVPVDFIDVKLDLKDPTDEDFEKVIEAIHGTGTALKVFKRLFGFRGICILLHF